MRAKVRGARVVSWMSGGGGSLYQGAHAFSAIKIKPIFHWKLGSRWLPNATEINAKNMKCTRPTQEFCIGTQRNLYSTDLHLGFTSGKMQIWVLHRVNEIRGSALAPRYQHVGIPNAKFCRGGIAQRHPPTPGILRHSGI